MLTRLLPMRMDVRRALGFSTQIFRGSGFFLLPWISAWKLALERLTKAVSDPEKNPERTRQIRIVIHSLAGTCPMAG